MERPLVLSVRYHACPGKSHHACRFLLHIANKLLGLKVSK
ncbi:MAG: hypothetical protein ACI9C4_002778 [Paraglaciecola sp.]|jgi:hypothetical protein